jgi:hypothetical protein
MTINAEDYPEFILDTAEDYSNEHQYFVDGEYGWQVHKLWAAVSDLPEYEVPLIALDTDHTPWDECGTDFMSLCAHVKLINQADLSYPIILTPKGTLADGRHRLAKAIVEGYSTIKVKRLVTMPEPDIVYDEDGIPEEL